MRFNLVVAAPLLVFLACNDAPGGSPSTGPCGAAIPKAQAARRYVEALCTLGVNCGEIGPADHAACVDYYERSGQMEELAASLADRRIDYNGAAMTCCLQEMSACDLFAGLPEVCYQAIRGKQAVGAPCDEDLQCATRNCVEGTCRALPREGEACEWACDEGLTCVAVEWEDEVGTCRRPGAVGEPCRTHTACSPGLACDATVVEGDYSGTCAPPAGPGERCTDWVPCVPPAEYYCAPTAPGSREGTCEPRIPDGGACRLVGTIEGDTGCEPGLLCMDAGEGEVCKTLPGEGEPCLGFECGYFLECFDTTCERPLFPGDACDEEEDHCIEGSCVDGTCPEIEWD